MRSWWLKELTVEAAEDAGGILSSAGGPVTE